MDRCAAGWRPCHIDHASASPVVDPTGGWSPVEEGPAGFQLIAGAQELNACKLACDIMVQGLSDFKSNTMVSNLLLAVLTSHFQFL